MTTDWPFDQPPDCAVITTCHVVDDAAPILYVVHDEEDHGWQFLPGGEITVDDARVVALGDLVIRDESLKQIAHLPPGESATRDAVGAPWRLSTDR